MMREDISTFFSFILILIMLVIAPVFLLYQGMHNKIASEVDKVTFKFVQDTRNKGYISKYTYENFLNNLSNTRNTYKVEIIHEKHIWYPLKPTDPKYTADKPYIILDDVYCEDQILETIYNNSKDYKMEVGDDISVTVTNNNETSFSVFNKLLGNINEHGIYSNFGGAIKNERY